MPSALLRRGIRIIGLLATLGLLAALVMVVLLWFLGNRLVVLPAPSGAFPVGRVDFDWVDQHRLETLGPDPHAQRELMVSIWYPAAAPAAGTQPAPYLPAAWARVRDGSLGASLLTQHLDRVRVHAIADAPLAPDQPTYPVLILEPGLGPLLTDYTTLAEDLASHGYIVVGSTPTYSASVVVFADGRVAWSSTAGTIPDAASPAASRRLLNHLIEIWSGDDTFLMDQVATLNRSDPARRFSGRMNLQAIGVLGHSFGGATAAQVCAHDARCKAGVDLDGYPYGDVVQRGLRQPFMFIWSEPPDPHDAAWQQAVSDTRTIYERLPHGYQLTLTGARHFNFADFAVLYAPIIKLSDGLGQIDGRRGLAITTTYVAAFFDRYLKGEPAPILDGPAPTFPEVQFRSR